MYSFGNRHDTTAIDEPFYGYYLDTHPEIDHPGRAETLASMPVTRTVIMDKYFHDDYPTDQVFLKNMAHHMDGTDWGFISELKNLFLIRNPRQLIASFAQVIPNPTILDIGLKLEWEILEYALEQEAFAVVMDSNEILKDPRKVLSLLCEKLDIPFKEEMLSWEAGPRDIDGCWAKYWYANVHKSTGFQKQKTSERPFPERLRPLLEEAQKYYDKLAEYSIRA